MTALLQLPSLQYGWRRAKPAALPLLFAIALTSAVTIAQDYPVRPVRVISPYPPGSSADIIGRIYSPRLTDALGK